MKKLNKGITLISLVVTIVVLLILAAISINVVLGKNGIISRTKDARERAEIAEEKEIVQFAVAEAKMYDSNGKLTFENLKNAMKGNSRNKKYTLTDEGDSFKITFDSGRDYYAEGDNSENGDDTYFIWELSDTEAKIVGLKDEAKELEDIKVPDIYNNLPVTTLNASFLDTKVKNVFIGKNITTISKAAFAKYLYGAVEKNNICKSLENIKVSKNNQKYADIDGVLVGKDGKYLIQYPFNKNGDEYTIPDSVETIGCGAFAYTKVKKINFNNVKNITGIDIFVESEMAKQTSIIIPRALDNREIVYAITYAATGAKNIQNISVENGNANFKSIDGVLFNNTGTILYYYPLNKAGNDYTTPSGTKVINSYAFPNDGSNGTKIRNLTFGKDLKGIRERAFYTNNILNIYMNTSIYYIGKEAFYCGDFLQTVNNIPRCLQIIEDNNFYKDKLDAETIKKIENINPNALYSYGASASVVMFSSYDYDMELNPVTKTVFDYTDDTQYDVEVNIPTEGEYVNYKFSGYSQYVSSSYSGTDDKYIDATKSLKWIILNIDDENGKVDLISDRPTDETISLRDSRGYNNAVFLLDNICNRLYGETRFKSTARNINLKDIESWLTQKGVDNRNKYVSDGQVKYGNTKTYYGFSYPGLYRNQKGNGLGNGTIYAPKLIKENPDPYEESDPINSGYSSGDSGDTSSGTVTQTAYKLEINNTYFNRGVNLLKSDTIYFINARCLNTKEKYPQFGIRCASDTIDFMSIFEIAKEKGSTASSVTATAHLRPIVTLDLQRFKNKDSNGNWILEEDDIGCAWDY